MARCGYVEENEERRTVFKFMLLELRRSRLEVVLATAPVPCHRGHFIRVVNNENPSWYKRVCSKYPSRSKSHRGNPWKHTRVKRRDVLKVLQKLVSSVPIESFLVDELVGEADELLQEWETEYENDA